MSSFADSNTTRTVAEQAALEKCKEILKHMDPVVAERYYGERASAKRRALEKNDPLSILLKLALSPEIPRVLKYPVFSVQQQFGRSPWISEPHSLLEVDSQVQKAFETFGRDFPTSIWTCCKRRCFALTAVLPEHTSTFNAVFRIYRMAENLYGQLDKVDGFVQSRKRGIGGTSIIHSSSTRSTQTDDSGTDRQKCLRNLKAFVERELPFL